jgi:predicted  nucleic acid-binding Zn-ribbon protein
MSDCSRCQHDLEYEFPFNRCPNCGFQEFTYIPTVYVSPDYLRRQRDIHTALQEVITEIAQIETETGLKLLSAEMKAAYQWAGDMAERYDDKLGKGGGNHERRP